MFINIFSNDRLQIRAIGCGACIPLHKRTIINLYCSSTKKGDGEI